MIRVHYKRGEGKYRFIKSIIFMIVFLCATAFLYAYVYYVYTKTQSISKTILVIIRIPLFVIVIGMFTFVSLFFVKSLFTRPKEYRAKLVRKVYENYNGVQLTYMTFLVREKNGKDREDKCYTLGKNSLVEEEEYTVLIKEFDWKMKYIMYV